MAETTMQKSVDLFDLLFWYFANQMANIDYVEPWMIRLLTTLVSSYFRVLDTLDVQTDEQIEAAKEAEQTTDADPLAPHVLARHAPSRERRDTRPSSENPVAKGHGEVPDDQPGISFGPGRDEALDYQADILKSCIILMEHLLKQRDNEHLRNIYYYQLESSRTYFNFMLYNNYTLRQMHKAAWAKIQDVQADMNDPHVRREFCLFSDKPELLLIAEIKMHFGATLSNINRLREARSFVKSSILMLTDIRDTISGKLPESNESRPKLSINADPASIKLACEENIQKCQQMMQNIDESLRARGKSPSGLLERLYQLIRPSKAIEEHTILQPPVSLDKPRNY